MPDLSIVIPTYQRCDSLRQVLLACGQQSLSPERYEVIVAIDGSTDATVEMLEQLDPPYPLRWTNGPNGGPGAARNRGAALARGDVILFLDDDIILTPPALAEHLAGHGDGEEVVCLGQVQLWPERPLSSWEQYLNQRYEEHYQKMNQPGYQPDFWDCLSGNISFPRSLWQQSGGFDPRFAAAKHDDIELGYRLNRMGTRFSYRPRALGYHFFVKSVAAGLHDAVTNGASAARLRRFHPGLTPDPVDMVWRHYARPVRSVLRMALVHPAWRQPLMDWSGRWLHRFNTSKLPLVVQRPFFRLAYHLHFWQGVYMEIGAAQWRALLAG